MAKKKTTRGGKRRPPSFNDYVLVIEDAGGKQLAVVEQSNRSRAPLSGEQVQLKERFTKDKPELAGTYIVSRVAHLPPPWAPVTINRYTLPWCYARRPAVASPEAATTPIPPLGPAEPDLDQTTAAEVARKSRDLATELDDLADELAVAFHGGVAGKLDRSLVQRLSDASRRAKQVSLSALFRAKIPRNSK
jgi:hypothetical protein